MRQTDEIDDSQTVRLGQAADLLAMSHSRLHAFLDRGHLAFHRVGRDRRIRVHDLLHFDEQRQRDRRELAERFASQQLTAATATDEIADLL